MAVIDTGVDSKHEDLQANLLLQNGKYKAFYNRNKTEATGDTGNHGTTQRGEWRTIVNEQDGRVLAVQPNYRYRIRSEENKDDENFTKSDRPYYQYFINAVKAREAWKKLGNKPAARTRVAVIDTGVDSKHEDLQANLLLQNGKYKAFYNGNETEATDDTVQNASGAGQHGDEFKTFGHYDKILFEMWWS